MKKTGVELFELIHSLSMAEKKYFKMFSSLQSGDKNYLKLYDAIEKQRSYDEGAIRTAYSGQKFLRQLFATKNRLYNNILRTLEIYHSSAEVNLHSQLSKAKILLRKELTAQGLKLLKNVKSIAYHHEQWELLMEVLVMERSPYTEVELLKMPHMNEEVEAVLQKLSNIHDYRKIYHQITYQINEVQSIRTRKEQSFIAKLMRHPLLRNSKQATCTEAKTCYYEIMSRYYLFKRDFIKGYETSKEQCDFIEAHLHQLSDPDKRYLFALNSSVSFLAYLFTRSDKYGKEMQEALQKIRAYPIDSSVKSTFWTYSYINELNAFMLMGDFEKVFPALKAIEGNEDMVTQTPAIARFNLYYNIAYLLFGTGSYKEASRWLKKIIDQPSELRKDTQASAYILYLLVHYELHKDEELLDSLQRSAMHFLSTRQRIFKVEESLMHCLQQIMGKSISRKKRSTALLEFKTSLLKLMKNPKEKAAMENLDFLSWVESKIQHKTFGEVVKEKAK
ncbi:MAG: hypothetical protein HY840_10220 [Bacteroidetes bacterium]|nr:hypothetical protein [Bacteroidota bacterium]